MKAVRNFILTRKGNLIYIIKNIPRLFLFLRSQEFQNYKNFEKFIKLSSQKNLYVQTCKHVYL